MGANVLDEAIAIEILTAHECRFSFGVARARFSDP
jgi:hypothetical protein